MPRSLEKCIYFSKGELNFKGELFGEKILTGDINHDTLNETASNDMGKKGSQKKICHISVQTRSYRDPKFLWKGYSI